MFMLISDHWPGWSDLNLMFDARYESCDDVSHQPVSGWMFVVKTPNNCKLLPWLTFTLAVTIHSHSHSAVSQREISPGHLNITSSSRQQFRLSWVKNLNSETIIINYQSGCEFWTHICHLNLFYCGMSICPCDLLPQNVALATQKELYSIYGRIHHTTVVPSHSILITVYERACGTW